MRRNAGGPTLDSQSSFSFLVDEGAYLLLALADRGKTVAVIDSLPLRIMGQDVITINLKGKHAKKTSPSKAGFLFGVLSRSTPSPYNRKRIIATFWFPPHDQPELSVHRLMTLQ